MPGYKAPCRYCGKLVPPDANVCPFCGKVSPLSQRCPRCRSPIGQDWQACDQCGLPLIVACPHCRQETFFGDYCQRCQIRLTVTCPNPKCLTEQPPLGKECIKCGKPLR